MARTAIAKNPRTDVDVRALLEKYPDMQPDGRIVAHEDVEGLLRLNRRHPYYKTVIRHWRRALFDEQRLFIDGRSALGQGFKVLTPDEMIRYSNRQVRAAGRILKKAVKVAATPREDEIVDTNVRAYRARLLSAAEQMLTQHGRVMREIGATLRPPAQLPRTAPVQ